jgi:hypothetical protein
MIKYLRVTILREDLLWLTVTEVARSIAPGLGEAGHPGSRSTWNRLLTTW